MPLYTIPAAQIQEESNFDVPHEYPPIILGDGINTSFTITGIWDNPYPDVRLYFQGKQISVDSVEITPNGNNSLTITTKGTNPIPAGSLVVIISAKKIIF